MFGEPCAGACRRLALIAAAAIFDALPRFDDTSGAALNAAAAQLALNFGLRGTRFTAAECGAADLPGAVLAYLALGPRGGPGALARRRGCARGARTTRARCASSRSGASAW